MNRPIAEDELSGKHGDRPLDPAVEQVRRKLLRFAIVNIGILFAALAVVVAALAWRTVSAPGALPAGLVEASLALPPGGQVVSHAVSPSEVSLLAALPDGSRAVFVYARQDGRLLGRYAVAPQ